MKTIFFSTYERLIDPIFNKINKPVECIKWLLKNEQIFKISRFILN